MEPITAELVSTVARVILGSVMLYYGWPKVRALASNANDFRMMGFSPPWLWGTVVAANEFLGGLAMLSGFYAEIAAATFGFQMLLGGLWKVFKAGKSFPDYSYDLLAFAACFLVVAHGSGAFALAHYDAAAIALRLDVALWAIVVAVAAMLLSKPRPRT